jgi:hypothetical protein
MGMDVLFLLRGADGPAEVGLGRFAPDRGNRPPDEGDPRPDPGSGR